MPLRLAPACYTVDVDINGRAPISIRVPGTFSGLKPSGVMIPDGRFVKLIEFWCDTYSAGDRLYDLRAEDTDGIIPVPARVAFAAYPVLFRFDESDLLETNGMSRGLWLRSSSTIRFSPFDDGGDAALDFIPSGVYLVGTFEAGDGLLGNGRKVRANLSWGKISAV